MVCVLFASVTTSEVPQAFVFSVRTQDRKNQRWMGIKAGVTGANYTLASPWEQWGCTHGC